MFNSKASLIAVLSLTMFFVVGMAITITYAYFSATRTTITTLSFHGGTTLTVIGTEYDTDSTNVGLVIGENQKAGKWQSRTNGGVWKNTNTDIVNSSLELSGLKVKAAQNSGTYVRVFVAVKIDNISTTDTTDGDISIPTLTFTPDMGSSVANVASTNYTPKESAFVSVNSDASSTLYTACAIITMPNNYAGFVKLFNNYTVFSKDRNNLQDSNYQFANIRAMVMLTSCTSNNDGAWQTSQDNSVYSFAY